MRVACVRACIVVRMCVHACAYLCGACALVNARARAPLSPIQTLPRLNMRRLIAASTRLRRTLCACARCMSGCNRAALTMRRPRAGICVCESSCCPAASRIRTLALNTSDVIVCVRTWVGVRACERARARARKFVCFCCGRPRRRRLVSPPRTCRSAYDASAQSGRAIARLLAQSHSRTRSLAIAQSRVPNTSAGVLWAHGCRRQARPLT